MEAPTLVSGPGRMLSAQQKRNRHRDVSTGEMWLQVDVNCGNVEFVQVLLETVHDSNPSHSRQWVQSSFKIVSGKRIFDIKSNEG